MGLNLKSTTVQALSQKSAAVAAAAAASKSSGKELIVDAKSPIDLNYAYMLVYINCNNMQANLTASNLSSNKLNITSTTNSSYDHVRTLFVLKCIEQILDKCTKDFLISITCTNLNPNYKSQMLVAEQTQAVNNTPYSVHNEKLLDLIYRHLKSIYGNSFYSSGSNSASNNIDANRPTTYIEAIIMILLFYIRSYYPPSSFFLTGAFKSPETLETAPSVAYSSQVKAQTLDSASRQKLSIFSTMTKSASASSLHSATNISHTSTPSVSSKSSNSSTLSHSSEASSVKFHIHDEDEYSIRANNANNVTAHTIKGKYLFFC